MYLRIIYIYYRAGEQGPTDISQQQEAKLQYYYCLFKKSCLFVHSNSLYVSEQDFFDIQYGEKYRKKVHRENHLYTVQSCAFLNNFWRILIFKNISYFCSLRKT